MPIFRPHEYKHDRPTLRDAWDRLPVVVTISGLEIRWLGPLVDLGHDVWLGEMSEGAWGFLEGSGWQEVLAEGGPMLTDAGRLRAPWKAAFAEAVRLLAAGGEYAGPESCPHRWASWVAFAHSEPRAYVAERAEAKGWDR